MMKYFFLVTLIILLTLVIRAYLHVDTEDITENRSEVSNTVMVSESEKYEITIPTSWYYEKSTSTQGSITFVNADIYNKEGRLVMRTYSPVPEAGIQCDELLEQKTSNSSIGEMDLYLCSTDKGFSHAQYIWEGGDDWWSNSFKVVVPIGETTQIDSLIGGNQLENVTKLYFTSLDKFLNERTEIEKIIFNILSK